MAENKAILIDGNKIPEAPPVLTGSIHTVLDRGPTPALMAEASEYKPDHMKCDRCPMLEACRERIRKKIWVLCEIPDQRDLMLANLWKCEMVNGEW